MFLPFHHFRQVKDKYCIAYFGNHDDYLLLLIFLRPYIERQFQGIQIYLACKDDSFYLLKNEPRVVKKSEFDKNNFCYVRYLTLDMNKLLHPVHELLLESDIRIPHFEFTNNLQFQKVSIFTEGILPTKSLDDKNFSLLARKYEQNGFTVYKNKIPDENCHLCSVENELFTSKMLSGIPCTLINSGLGTDLYRTLFPSLKVISI